MARPTYERHLMRGLEEPDEIDRIFDPCDLQPDMEPELSEILPRGYLSPSQVTTFLKCPHLWELSYVYKKPRTASGRMFQGVAVHSAVEAVLKTRLATGKIPEAALATDAFSDAFEASKALVTDWETSDAATVKDVGIACTRAYYETAAHAATPLVVEKSFLKVYKSADGKTRLPVLGRIDSIQAQTTSEAAYQEARAPVAQGADPATVPVLRRIHDLKVVTDKWSPSDIDNDVQFTIYGSAEGLPNVQVDQVIKGRAKIPRPHYAALTGVITPKAIDHVLDVVNGVAKSITLGHFPKTDPGNWWCSAAWCGMWQHCRGR